MNINAENIGECFDKVPFDSGFAMDGYWVWCGSVIKAEDGRYHMFASRWPKTLPFHPGWGVASEIVRAVSDTAQGPYTFAEVVLSARGAEYWDGRVTHNPSIQKCGDEYVLFYTGSTYPMCDVPHDGSLNNTHPTWLCARSNKRIGIATAKSINGPWLRRDAPCLDVRSGYFDNFLTSNPAPCINEDGSCLLVYKTRTYVKPPYADKDMFSDMSLGVAYAEHYTKPFTRLCNEPIFSVEKGVLEDPFIWKTDFGYAMIAKDWKGTYTNDVGSVVYAKSTDGISWSVNKERACSRDITWQDGTKQTMGNMDRPFILMENGEATHLFVATNDGKEAGFGTMTKSWNMCIPLKEEKRIFKMDKQELQKSIENAVDILRLNLDKYTDKFEDSNTVNGVYVQTENVEWTTGFLTGEYWLAYEFTHDDAFKTSALKQVNSFYDRIVNKIDVNHHDMGFLYTPSCVAAYKLTGSVQGKKAAILAADNLAARFQEKGQFLQAWGELGAEDNYRLIIDCLLNVPLLYWASEVTDDDSYADKARRHTKTSLANLIRPDNSTYHTYFFDKNTGEPTHGVTRQGYRDGSAWARGQAWSIYGTALSYKDTHDEQCIELFHKVTDFFISKLPDDLVPYWDLDFTDGDGEPKDSSAAAIAVCGMFEMSKYLAPEDGEYYKNMAMKILKSLMDNYAVASNGKENGLLLHGVYAKASPFNPIPKDRGVDECNTWGDYFYLEALTRAFTDWKLYW